MNRTRPLLAACALASVAAALSPAAMGRAAEASTETTTEASAKATSYACADRAHIARLSSPLNRMRRLVAAGRAVTVMALGSSSTAGAGASSPASSYPARLELELRKRFPGVPIRVINRGVNGEEAGDMLERFDGEASDDKPDVVLWQLGTNSVLRDRPVGEVDQLIARGLMRMKALGVDVVLIDLQFAPEVLGKRSAESVLRLIETASTKRSVDLFPRFRIMREWHDSEAIPFETFLSSDQLHMNDWGYSCFAKLLGAAIAEAATRPVVSAAGTTVRGK